MTKELRKLNNVLLDIRIIMNQMDRNPRAEITNMKVQLKSALFLFPAFAEQVDDIRSLNALYQFAKHVLEELKIQIQIEKEK